MAGGTQSAEHLRAELDRALKENKRLVAKLNEKDDELIDLRRSVKGLERRIRNLIAPAIIADMEALRTKPPQT